MISSTFPLTSVLDKGEWLVPRPGRFTPRKDPVPIVQEPGWVPGPVWTHAESVPSSGIRSPDRPARSQSLYRLSYPGYGLKDRGIGVRFSVQAKIYSPLFTVQNCTGDHLSFYPKGNVGFSLAVKRPGCEADHSHFPSAGLKQLQSYNSIALWLLQLQQLLQLLHPYSKFAAKLTEPCMHICYPQQRTQNHAHLLSSAEDPNTCTLLYREGWKCCCNNLQITDRTAVQTRAAMRTAHSN